MSSTDLLFDVEAFRAEFPILNRQIGSKHLVYLDNGASSQRPQVVIDRLARYASYEHANIHRGVHQLSQSATEAYEAARKSVARFINAQDSATCLFTRGTTESINLVASTWGEVNVGEGDEILLTAMEHHANIVPWQLLAEKKGARIVVVPVLDNGELDIDAFHRLLNARTRIVAFVHVSNALGTVNPAKAMIEAAHEAGARVLLDGAQSAPHLRIDVEALGCDFFTFSAHKVGGPTGIGLCYGKREVLDGLPPYQGGGDMIERVSFEGTTFRGIPERYEAGTPNIEGAIGFAAALEFLLAQDRLGLEAHERSLLEHATEALSAIEGLRIYGQAENKVPLMSFTIEGAHHSDLGILLDMDGIAIRNGHHCCMPLWQQFGIEGTARASFAAYNTHDEVDQLAQSLVKIKKMLGA